MTEKGIYKSIYDRAYKNDPKATWELRSIFATTDMSVGEYIAHLKIIADGKKSSCENCKHRKKESIHLDNGRDGYFCYQRWGYVPCDIVGIYVCNQWEDGQ